jgi:prickle
MSSKKLASLEKGFTWQPSGLTPQEIKLFFENYPSNNVPKLGTYGEKWREKALMYQMPKQDISKEFCKFLKIDNEKRYKEFVEERNSKALEIGICFKNKSNEIVSFIINTFSIIF